MNPPPLNDIWIKPRTDSFDFEADSIDPEKRRITSVIWGPMLFTSLAGGLADDLSLGVYSIGPHMTEIILSLSAWIQSVSGSKLSIQGLIQISSGSAWRSSVSSSASVVYPFVRFIGLLTTRCWSIVCSLRTTSCRWLVLPARGFRST